MSKLKEEATELLNTFHYTAQFWIGYDHDEKLGYLLVEFSDADYDAGAPTEPVYEYLSKGMYNRLVGIHSSRQREAMQYEERLVEGEDVEQVLVELAK